MIPSRDGVSSGCTTARREETGPRTWTIPCLGVLVVTRSTLRLVLVQKVSALVLQKFRVYTACPVPVRVPRLAARLLAAMAVVPRKAGMTRLQLHLWTILLVRLGLLILTLLC